MRNYLKKNFFLKKYCFYGPRKIPKDTCMYNSPIKCVSFYNSEPLNQTIFRINNQKEQKIANLHRRAGGNVACRVKN